MPTRKLTRKKKPRAKSPPVHLDTEEEVEVLDLKGKPVPHYLESAGFSLGWTPSGPDEINMVITGMPGGGKSSFVASDPNALILDFEGSTRQVLGRLSPTVHIDCMDQLESSIDTLTNKGKTVGDYGRVVFDTMDAFQDMAMRYVLEKHNAKPNTMHADSFGDMGMNAWFRLRDFMHGYLLDLNKAGYRWTAVLNLMLDERKDNRGNTTSTYTTMLAPSIKKRMYRDADAAMLVLRDHKGRYHLTAEMPEGDEALVETKTRYRDILPAKIPIPLGRGWPSYVDVFQSCVSDHSESELISLANRED